MRPVGGRNDLGAESFVGVGEIHREVIRDVPGRGLGHRLRRGLMRQPRIGPQLRQVRAQTERHDAELPVLEIGFDGPRRNAAFDVRLDH